MLSGLSPGSGEWGEKDQAMRANLALLLIVVASGLAQGAHAAGADAALTALNRAAFAKPRPDAEEHGRRHVEAHLRQGQGASSPVASSQAPLAADQLFSSSPWALSAAAASWRSQSISSRDSGGAVDTVRLTVASTARGPGGLVLAEPGSRFAPDTQSVNLDFERAWPSALSIANGRYDVDVAPHAGLSMTDYGGSAPAGAAIRLQLPEARSDSVGRRLGFTTDREGASSSRGRWFLFAEGSGELVGVHLSRNGGGFMPHAALTVDDGIQPTVVSDSQAGIGWRRGDLQASFGYVHREIRNDASAAANRQTADIKGDMVAVTFSLRPR